MSEHSTLIKPFLIFGAVVGIAAMLVPLLFLEKEASEKPIDIAAMEAAHAAMTTSSPTMGPTEVPEVVSFNRDIRPILSDNCFVCHGNDKGSRKAELSIATLENVMMERKNGVRPIIPGDGANSEIIKRLRHSNPEDRMPPQSTGKSLSDIEIAIVEKWIDQGGEYEKHWSYNVPVKYDVPVISSEWVNNPIDNFVARKQTENGLTPSEEADKRTLLRRVTFDLTGLPPTLEEINDFVNDQSDDAYDKVVDRLMASANYGERMGMNWMDVVRYADSWGYHSDNERTVWPYRDYIINAFNENKSFADFTREQLAGDMIEGAGTEGLTASTYNQMIKITQEGGAQDREYMMKYLIDRVSSVGTGWLGTTTACAQCHDHKFDPFTAKDFYSLGAFFADIDEKGFWGSSRIAGKMFETFPIEFVGSDTDRTKFKDLYARYKKNKALLPFAKDAKDLDGLDDWLNSFDSDVAEDQSVWSPVTIKSAVGTNHPEVSVENNDIIRTAWDIFETKGQVVIIGSGDFPEKITALQLAFLSEDEGEKWDIVDGKNYSLSFHDVRVSVIHQDGSVEETRLDYHATPKETSQDDSGVPEKDTQWAAPNFGHYRVLRENLYPWYGYTRIIGNRRELRGDKVSLHLQDTLNWQAGDELRIEMDLAYRDNVPGGEVSQLPSTRILVTDMEHSGPDPDRIIAIGRKAVASRTEEDNKALRAYYERFSPKALDINYNSYDAEFALMEFSDTAPRTWVTKTLDEPKITKILPRGDWMDETGEVVEPAIPGFLGELKTNGKRASRLDLANWLVSRENPLTSRVVVNRFWKQFFGVGLSNVLDDLGNQGEWPTHPELLDWLAVEFIDSGWDMKHMVRLMVTSSTYKQSSFVDEEFRDKDPFNRFYARQSQIRLPAEIIRDNTLAVSGLLVNKVGGPSVRPYQPTGYLSDLEFPPRVWVADQAENQYRRGLYTFWQRTRLHPAMRNFDAPSREVAVADRVTSNTPLQSLVLLNDPTFVEAAKAFALEIMKVDGDNDEKIKWAFERTLSRPVSDNGELELLRDAYNNHLSHFTSNMNEADELLKVGFAPTEETYDKAELAAWMSVARIMLNLHETVTRF